MDIFRRDSPAEVRQHHELDEALRLTQKMRNIGGIRPVREVKVLGVTRTTPEGPDFIEKVDELRDKYGRDGKDALHQAEEIAEFVGSGDHLKDDNYRPPSSRHQGLRLDEEGPWDGASRASLDEILAEED